MLVPASHVELSLMASDIDTKIAEGHVEDVLKKGDKARVKSVLSVPLQEAIAKAKPRLFTLNMFKLYCFIGVAQLTCVAKPITPSDVQILTGCAGPGPTDTTVRNANLLFACRPGD